MIYTLKMRQRQSALTHDVQAWMDLLSVSLDGFYYESCDDETRSVFDAMLRNGLVILRDTGEAMFPHVVVLPQAVQS